MTAIPGRSAGAAPIDVERLAQAIWNTISTLPHAEHDSGECETCDTHRMVNREVVDNDARLIAAEYARLLDAAPSPAAEPR